jgi:ligand-binding SRPBCC domain-containing protein
MPVFESAVDLACSPQQAFEFLARPANLLLVTPPDVNMTLVDAPERLTLGSKITAKVSKFGVPQKITNEVTAFEEGVGFTDVQVSGPFKKFEHTHRVEPAGSGTRIFDRIEYEAPGGLVGLLLTNKKIQEYLETLDAYRAKRFKELLK